MTRAAISTLSVISSLVPTLAFAQEGGEKVDLLSPSAGVMFWTLVIFVLLMIVLAKFAYKPLFALVEEREKSLEDAVEGAKRDRAEAAAQLEKQRAELEAARVEAQRIIAESRATAEKVRADLLAQTKQQQGEMLESARKVIESEKVKAVAELRLEAIELAIAGASKVINQNLDSANNRQIVEGFLASLNTQPAKR